MSSESELPLSVSEISIVAKFQIFARPSHYLIGTLIAENILMKTLPRGTLGRHYPKDGSILYNHTLYKPI